MPGRRRFRLRPIGSAILLAGCVVAAQTPSQFKARLSTVPISAADLPRVQGSGSATAVLDGTSLVINGTFQGLVSPATEAHVRQAPKGLRGPAVFVLTVTPATSGTISGTRKLTREQVEALEAGTFYIQIHSQKAPEGNLRGWLLR